jgi:hypothetical protein
MINNLYIKATPTTASVTWGDITGTLSDQTDLQSALDAKQATLVSGTNIKTINSTSLLGSGNVAVEPTITAGTTSQYYRGDKTFQTLDKSAVGLSNVDNTSDVNKPVSTAQATAIAAKQDTLVSGTNIKTINSTSLLGSGDIVIGGAPAWLESNATDLTIWNNGKGNIVSNTSFGDGALKSNTTGTLNTAIGYNALDANTNGNTNTAVGVDTLGASASGSESTAIGYGALQTKTQSLGNTAVGAYSQQLQTAGWYNTAIGTYALRNNSVNNNTAVGYQSLLSNTTGTENTAVGYNSLDANTTGIWNTAVGSDALGSVTTSGGNTAVGYTALTLATSGSNNTAIGTQSMSFRAVTGHSNVAIGIRSLYGVSSGTNNTAIGAYALQNCETGSANVAIGRNALSANDTGNNNTAIGYYTVSGNFNGSVILGYQATATANNQFVVGSSGTNAGAVTTESLSSTKTWSVVINGVAQKILLA